MKKTLSGMAAYSKMRSAELPDRTATYTPIPHIEVIQKVKEQIIKSGFIISGENYNCSQDGKIGVGTFGIVFQQDPDITLGLSFLNSYNKTYAFRVSMGGQLKGSSIPFQLNDKLLGQFKRLHTGAADILSSDKISEMIRNSDEVWKKLYDHKEYLKTTPIPREHALSMVFDLFLDEKLTTFQMNFIRKELTEICPKSMSHVNSWDFYKTLLTGVSEAHPTTWINDMIYVHDLMMNTVGFPVEEESENELDLADMDDILNWLDSSSDETEQEKDEEDIKRHEREEFDEDEFDGEHDEEDESEIEEDKEELETAF